MSRKRLMALALCVTTFVTSNINVFAANKYVTMTLTYDYTNHRYSAEEVFVAINGNKLTGLKMPPIVLNDFTLVPAREVFEAMGATVEWKKELEQVYVKYNDKLVVIPIGSTKAYVNGTATNMQTAAKIINNKTMIPLRFVATSLGMKVNWNKTTRIADIDTGNISSDNIDDTTITTTVAVTTTEESTTEATTLNTTTEATTSTTEATTVTTKETTTETTSTVADINNISSIILTKGSSSKDSLVIQGDYTPKVKSTFSSDGKTLTLDIENSKLNIEKGYTGEGIYVSEGYYYQNNNNVVTISLKLKSSVSVDIRSLGNNKTTALINYSSSDTGATTDKNTSTNSSQSAKCGYDAENGRLYIKNDGSINIKNILEADNYNDLNYKLTLNGDYSNILSNATYTVNSAYVNSITVNVTSSSTVININEKKIMAVDISESNGYVYIKPVLPKEKYDKIIVLDAGHGGSAPGASGNGLIEKNLTLSMLNKARALFDKDGTIKCYATRTTDIYPSFNDRTDLGNEVGDAFISIHINAAANASAAGTETYSLYANDQGNGLTSYGLASEILNNLLSQLGTKNRKVKSENWIVLRQSKIPATLIEIGFITNSGDASIMGSDAGQQKVAQAIFDSVKTLFNKYKPVR